MVSLNDKNVTDPSAVPDFIVAAEKLLQKVNDEHSGSACLECAEEAKATAADKSAQGSSSTDTDPGVLQALMQLKAAEIEAKRANEASLVAQRAAEAAAANLERLHAVLHTQKKQRVDATTDDDGPTQGVDEWTLDHHRREATRGETPGLLGRERGNHSPTCA